MGDTHAAQGDGEVCGTAIESSFDVVLTLDLIKDTPLKTPRFTTPDRSRHLDTATRSRPAWSGSVERGEDAVANTVELLAKTQNILLTPTCLPDLRDLRISEIVDMPNVVVSFYFPRSVFE